MTPADCGEAASSRAAPGQRAGAMGDEQEFLGMVDEMIKKLLDPPKQPLGGARRTGAAPPEFSNSVGMPLEDGLTLAHALLIGAGLRDRVKLIAAGKVLTGFSVVKTLALGADICNAARAMMFGECSSGVEWCGVELRE